MLMASALATMAHSRPSLPFIRGANVGSYFVPERWMAPSFYSGTQASSLCELVRYNRSLADERMRQHLESFVVEEDFAWLAERGFNAVRVPVGYWNAVGAAGGIPYVPASPSMSFTYLDRLFEWGRKHGLAVLLDLHGAPGSQNGADHSGCDSDGVGWHGDASVKLSLAAVETFSRRYAPHPSFLGIELMNEPGWAVEWDHGQLLEYYTRAHALIQAASPSALVVFNVLFWDDFPVCCPLHRHHRPSARARARAHVAPSLTRTRSLGCRPASATGGTASSCCRMWCSTCTCTIALARLRSAPSPSISIR